MPQSLDEDFTSDDWRVRFSAVDKTTLLFRFLEERVVRNSLGLRAVLSHAFCCLIASIDDINVHVSQKAVLCLGTIHDMAIATLIWCLEYQFDIMPVDRYVPYWNIRQSVLSFQSLCLK